MKDLILFSLENCIKCTKTKELLLDRNDIKIITFPHDVSKWNEEQLFDAKFYNVFEDLQKTAPILWINGEKKVGFLRIKKWIEDNKKL